MLSLPKIDRRKALNLWAQGRRRLRRTWLTPKLTALWLEFGATWAGSWDLRGSFDFKLGDRSPSDMEIWVKRTGVDADFYLFGTFAASDNTFTIPHLMVDPPDFTPFNVEVKLRYNNYTDPPGPFSLVKEVTNFRAFAPVLRAAYPDLLRWDWSLPNPYKWNVWMSLDGGASYVLIEDYWAYGNARQFAPDGGSEKYFIVGVDAAGNEITQRSNVIRPDDGPASVPQSVPGLQLWLRTESLGSYADSEPVATWPDSSGQGHDLTQLTSASQPTFAMSTVGQPSVYFDGLDDVLGSAASVFTTDEHTIFIVARPDATGECDLLGTGNTDTGDVLMMLYGDHLRGHAWRTGALNVVDSLTSINTTSLAVFEQQCSATDISLRLSGGLEATQVVDGTSTAAIKPVRLGSRDTGSNFNGHILAVLVYDRALTELEAETVRQFLTTTYNVPLPYGA